MEINQETKCGISGGYCEGCKTYYVALKFEGAPELSKHGYKMEAEAHGLWKAACDLMSGRTEPHLDIPARVNAVLRMLGMSDVALAVANPKPSAPMPDLGRPHFG